MCTRGPLETAQSRTRLSRTRPGRKRPHLQVRSGSNYSANTERRTRHIANARIGAYCAKPPHQLCAHKCSSEGVR
jgi:hypothetical protein